MDFGHFRALGQVEPAGDMRGGGNEADMFELVDDFISHRRHRFGEALQRTDVLEGFWLGDEGALAVKFENEAFLLQIAERLPHGDAADVEHRAEVVFGRHLGMGCIRAIENARAQRRLDLLVERSGGKRQHVGRVGFQHDLGVVRTCYDKLHHSLVMEPRRANEDFVLCISAGQLLAGAVSVGAPAQPVRQGVRAGRQAGGCQAVAAKGD